MLYNEIMNSDTSFNQLINKLTSLSEAERKDGLKLVKEMKGHNPIPHLLIKLKDEPNPNIRIVTIESIMNVNDLTMMKDHTITKDLITICLEDDDTDVRIKAIQALAHFKAKESLDVLYKLVNRSFDERIIKAASQATQIIEGTTEEWSMDN